MAPFRGSATAETKILIVDDEPAVRSLLHCALKGPGITLFEADSAKNALAVAAEQAPFALVVTDVLMPGMDGVELARQLSAAGSARKFLFVSGYCDAETLAQRAKGIESSFLAKPFLIAELHNSVRAML